MGGNIHKNVVVDTPEMLEVYKICTGLFLPLIFLNGNDPFTETFCSSGSVSNLGRIKFRVGGVILANLANNGLINVVLCGGRWLYAC